MTATPDETMRRDADPNETRVGLLLTANLFVLSAAAFAAIVNQKVRAALTGWRGDVRLAAAQFGFLVALLIAYTLLAAKLDRIVLAVVLAGAGCAGLAATAALSLLGWGASATLACGVAASCIGVAAAHVTALAVDGRDIGSGLRVVGRFAAGAAAGACAASAGAALLLDELGLEGSLVPIGALLGCSIALSLRPRPVHGPKGSVTSTGGRRPDSGQARRSVGRPLHGGARCVCVRARAPRPSR